MSGARLPLRARLKVLPAFSVFALLGLFAAWLALSSLGPSVRAIVSRAPSVAFSPRDTIGLPLALLCFALAGLTLVQQPDVGPRQRPNVGKRRVSGLAVCLVMAATSVLLTVVVVPIAEIVVSAVTADRHYVRCPAPLHERRAPMRWVLGEGRCP